MMAQKDCNAAGTVVDATYKRMILPPSLALLSKPAQCNARHDLWTPANSGNVKWITYWPTTSLKFGVGWVGGLEPNYRLRHQHFAKWSKQIPINNINYDQIVQRNLRLCSTVLNFGVPYRMFVCLKAILWLKLFNIATYMITLAVKLFIESNFLFWNLT